MADKKTEKRGLGRGLSALMADIDTPPAAAAAPETKSAVPASDDINVPIEKVTPNPDQPRTDFDKADLEDLANSIREKGIIQPLIVRTDPKDSTAYQIVAGERRWRAAQLAKLHEIPVIVRQLEDLEVLEIAIIENIQRSDLNPIEEALGYRHLQDKFGHTQDQLATALGKSRSHIANLTRLLNLPDEVLTWVREGKLSAGHARALVTADEPAELARMVIQKRLSVRETEALAKTGLKPESMTSSTREVPPAKDADTVALEGDLAAALGLKVSIGHKPNSESGTVTISYKTFDQLDALCRKMSRAE